MKSMPGSFVLAVAVALGCLPSCRKHVETQKADLGEAGYRFTPEEWFRACRGNDVAALKKFVAAGFSATTRNSEGDTALHVAAGNGALGEMEFLLERRQDVDVRGAGERTPLMSAVITDQAEMVRWLLRQGADANLKDYEGYKPLMLAVREGSAATVGELAARDREDLDAALLLAAMMDKPAVIDALTSFGASVHARMDDGRTGLMVAAENGGTESVKILLEVGASRLATDAEGRTAADLAMAAGHPDLAALISRDPLPADLALDSPETIAGEMTDYVDAVVAKADEEPAKNAVPSATGAGTGATLPVSSKTDPSLIAKTQARREAAVPLQDQTLGKQSDSIHDPATAVTDPATQAAAGDTKMPELVMRHYRDKDIPVRVKSVQGEVATIALTGASIREIKVRAGDAIPGSNLVVVRVRRRMEDSKVNLGVPTEISVVDVQDRSTGVSREWVAGIQPNAHEPVALVEDAATGKRYVASPGQRFYAADGAEFMVSDVRPNQLVIRESATGEAKTIPLRGPRG